jgi:hypothetical protein
MLDSGGKRRDISFRELKNAVRSNFFTRTGIMPLGVRHYEKAGNRRLVAVEVRPKVMEVKYRDYKMYVPFPGVLMVFKICDGRMSTAWCFALKESVSRGDVKLWKFPFSNTCSIDDHICWGSGNEGRVPRQLDVRNILAPVHIFLTSPWNNHWDEGKFTRFTRGGTKVRRCYDLMRALEGKAEFDYSILKESSAGTYASFMEANRL